MNFNDTRLYRLVDLFRITIKCWGRSIFMGPRIIVYEFHICILYGPMDDGSLSIAIRLQAVHMDCFEKFCSMNSNDIRKYLHM